MALIPPSGSFNLTVTEDDDGDFDAAFEDMPDVLPTAGDPFSEKNGDKESEEEDWDKEISAPTHPQQQTSLPSKIPSGLITNLNKTLHNKKVSNSTTSTSQKIPVVAMENWDDDDDLEFPAPSVDQHGRPQPLRLSFSPRTKAKIDSDARATNLFSARSPDSIASVTVASSAGGDGDEEDAGNASTIKVSKLPFTLPSKSDPSAKAPSTSSQTASARSEKSSKLNSLQSSLSSLPSIDDDFEDDFALPESLDKLSLRPLATLSHRTSKSSLDPWGDTNTLYSDGSVPSLTNPSQPETEEEDDFGTDDNTDDLDGILLPDSLSSKDMNNILHKKKTAPVFSAESVKVAGPQGEDDFEIGLVIGDDDELSPGKLSRSVISRRTEPRAVGKGASRSYSAPTGSLLGALSSNESRPESRPESKPDSRRRFASGTHQPSLGRTSRTNLAAAAASQAPTTHQSSSRPPSSYHEAPSLRRKTSANVGTSLRSQARQQSVSSSSITSTSSTGSKSSKPTPSTLSSTSTLHPESSTSSTVSLSRPGSSPAAPAITRQPSHSRLLQPLAAGAKKLARKASLSAIIDSGSSRREQVRSPTSGIDEPSSAQKETFPGKLAARYKTLTHASSYRDLSSPTGSSTSSRSNPPLDSLFQQNVPAPQAPLRSYEAATAASRAKGLRKEDKFQTAASSGSSASLRSTKSRGALSGVFATSAVSPALSGTRSPSPSRSRPRPNPTSPSRSSSQASHVTSSTYTRPTTTVRHIKRPKKSRVFGDGTELDNIEDLLVERDKESRYRVTPVSRGNVKTSPTASTSSAGDTSQSRRRTDSNTMNIGPSGLGRLPSKRPLSAASSNASTEPQAFPSLRRKPTQSLKMEVQLTTPAPPPMNTARRSRRNKSGSSPAKKKPTLIRNLGSAATPKVVGEMKWNPESSRWEGNDSILRDFETSSVRPALITPFAGSSGARNIGSPTPGIPSSIATAARVVGDMLFDPIKMCWISTQGDEDDPFADFSDEEDWEKGGTIRANLNILGPDLTGGHMTDRESGASWASVSATESVDGSPGRSSSRGGTRSCASEYGSDTESLPGGYGREAGSIRSSKAPSLALLQEGDDDDLAMDIDSQTMVMRSMCVSPAFVAACMAAEERHMKEMGEWNGAPKRTSWQETGSSLRSALRTAVSGRDRRSKAVALDPSRAYLWDIRTLADQAAG